MIRDIFFVKSCIRNIDMYFWTGPLYIFLCVMSLFAILFVSFVFCYIEVIWFLTLIQNIASKKLRICLQFLPPTQGLQTINKVRFLGLYEKCFCRFVLKIFPIHIIFFIFVLLKNEMHCMFF